MTHCVIFVFCCLFVCFFFYISQYITTQIFRVCMKELNRHQGYDPVTVTSLIIGNSHLLSCLNLDVLNSSLFGPSRISMTVCNRICSVIKGADGLMPFRKIARLCIQQRFEFNCYLFSLTQSTFIMKGKK